MKTLSLVGLVTSAAGTAGLLLLGRRGTLLAALVVLLVALTGYAAVLRAAAAGVGSRRLVTAMTIVLLGIAVTLPPWPSQDLYVYAMQGRIVTAHGDNPYVQPPNRYPDDPWLQRVEPAYRGGRAFYGPAFVALSAIGAVVARTSLLVGRLYFQGLAALAVLVSMALLARSTKGAGALAFIGLNPVLITRGVNEAHLDVLLGLVLLVAVLLLRRRRELLAGACLGLAALVKIFALLPFIAAVAWTWRRRGVGEAVRVAVAGGVTIMAGYVLAGGWKALSPLRMASDDVSRASIWGHLRRLLADAQGPLGDGSPTVSILAVAAVAAIAVAIVVTWWGDDSPERPMGGALAAYLLAGPYVLAWYPAGALTPLALRWRTGLALLVSAQTGLLGIAYVNAAGPAARPVSAALRSFWSWWLPMIELIAAVGLVVLAVRRAWKRRGDAGGIPPPRSLVPGDESTS